MTESVNHSFNPSVGQHPTELRDSRRGHFNHWNQPLELIIHRAKAVALSPPDHALTEARNALLDGAGVSFTAVDGA